MDKKLVAYFSSSGVTANVASVLAEAYSADLFEIKPEIPYKPGDLDWTNKKSRSSVEMADLSSRPAIVGKVENFEEYDTVYVGFPIWWYIAPTIINTFLEEYDWTGKTIVLFATSGGSGFGRTAERLAGSCKGAILKEGKVLNGCISKEDLLDMAF
ncbi:MAG: flavodoxin [Ruminococcus sp.]|nr:flavodoxin [Ruminococcus sp.]